jgi:hypothetical protein
MPKLMDCKDCGHQVSKRADYCPNCGARFVQRWYEIRGSNIAGCLIWIVIALIIFAVFAI